MREATRDEIKQIARAHMAEGGLSSLSLNAIARAIEVVPSALYRYFPDRNALIAALIVDALHDLAAEVRAAVAIEQQGVAGDQLFAAARAYRRWALAHPVDFQLCFGSAPPDDVATPHEVEVAVFAVFSIYLDIMAAAAQRGQLRVNPWFTATTVVAYGPETPFVRYTPGVMHSGIAGWSRMHGLVMLELFGQSTAVIADPARFFDDELRAGIAQWGLELTHQA
jgi:AcrR family transcriptional regulator